MFAYGDLLDLKRSPEGINAGMVLGRFHMDSMGLGPGCKFQARAEV